MKKKTDTEDSDAWKNHAAELTPDQLETLAVKFCPELYKQNPAEGIRVAKKFLEKGDLDAWRTVLELQLPQADKEWQELEAKKLAKLHLEYDVGVKAITGEKLYLAKDRFARFLLAKYGKSKADATSRRFQRAGFTGTEAKQFQMEFLEWWPGRNPRKGKQGQVLSKYDKRVGAKISGGPIAQRIFHLSAEEKATLHKAAVSRGWKDKLGENFAIRNLKKGKKGDVGWTTAEVVAKRQLKKHSANKSSNAV